MHEAFLSDQQLVELALAGSEAACRTLIERYQRPVFSLIYRLVQDHDKAEDLAQETFLKVFRALHQYRPNYKFSSWIFRIAHHEVIAEWRKPELPTVSLNSSVHSRDEREAFQTALAVTCDRPLPDQQVYNRELAGFIERAIADLRPEYRTAILLRNEGYSYQDVDSIMSVPFGSVRSYLLRARSILMERLASLRAAA